MFSVAELLELIRENRNAIEESFDGKIIRKLDMRDSSRDVEYHNQKQWLCQSALNAYDETAYNLLELLAGALAMEQLYISSRGGSLDANEIREYGELVKDYRGALDIESVRPPYWCYREDAADETHPMGIVDTGRYKS